MSPGFSDQPPLFRPALEEDVPVLERLIPLSVHGLQAATYSEAQREAAIGPVFGVDRTLIQDGTYWVATIDGVIAACGGWSRRKTLFGGEEGMAREATLLDPAIDAARIRAFFVHPECARRGLGSTILRICEEAARSAGFRSATLVATLAGEALYGRRGYTVEETYDLVLPSGLPLPVVRMGKSLV